MNPVSIYSYSRCSTCRRAIKWLEINHISFEVIDIIENPPSKELLSKAITQLPSRKLVFNTSGASYRALGASLVKAMNQEEALNALVNDGKLIKRPFLITSKGIILVGFNPDAWSDALLE